MKKRRFIATLLVLALAVCVFPVSAFADNPSFEVPTVKARAIASETITMQHTDVVVRANPGTSSDKLGTLYVGDTVVVTDWQYEMVGSYWWVEIEWGARKGYVREDLIP